MSNIGVIVDGRGDFHSLKTRFTGTCKILKTDGPRGHTTSINDIVSGSIKQISMLIDCGYQAIVVMVDFEMRNENYDKFVKVLNNEFARIYSNCKVDVAVPNRMIENWYLADIRYLSKRKVFLKNKLKQKNYEGSHGKDELKKCFAKGFTYSETVHGPQLFQVLRFSKARKNSCSFHRFLLIVEGNIHN